MKTKSSKAKKTTKKRSSSKAKSTRISIDERLTENFVGLQKVMTNLAKRFDNLSEQITKLLQLFEISAKVLAEKDYKKNKSESEEKAIKENMEKLLEQNKIIARGLTLMNEKFLENPEEGQRPQRVPGPQLQQKPSAAPQQPPQSEMEGSSREVDSQSGYEKSLSTTPNKSKKPVENKTFKKLPSNK